MLRRVRGARERNAEWPCRRIAPDILGMIVHSPSLPLCLPSPFRLPFFCSDSSWADEPTVVKVDGFGMLWCSGESNAAAQAIAADW